MQKRIFLPYAAALALLAIPAGSAADIVINEIMYDPISTDNNASTEWIELYNTSAAQVDISGYRVTAGTFQPYTFPANSTIDGHGYIILQSHDLDTFLSYYMDGIDADIVHKIDVGATVGSKLGNGTSGATIVLYDASDVEVDRVNYRKDNGWPATPNDAENNGRTLELVDAGIDNDDGTNWRVSKSVIGTPGRKNSQALATWYTAGGHSPQFPSSTDPVVFSIDVESLATISNVYLYLENLAEGPGFTQFTMTDNGGGNYSYTAGPFSDKTFLRYYISVVDSNGDEAIFPPLAPQASGALHIANNPVSSAQIVINEIMHNPPGADNQAASEYIEIYNKTAEPIDLSNYNLGRTLSDSYWRTLPVGLILPANGFVVAVGQKGVFDEDWSEIIDPSVPVHNLAWKFGQSILVNAGSEVFIASPNTFDWFTHWSDGPTGAPVQHVDFDPLGADGWPTEAASNGTAMELNSPELDPQAGSNWSVSTAAEGGTPGAVNSVADVADWNLY